MNFKYKKQFLSVLAVSVVSIPLAAFSQSDKGPQRVSQLLDSSVAINFSSASSSEKSSSSSTAVQLSKSDASTTAATEASSSEVASLSTSTQNINAASQEESSTPVSTGEQANVSNASVDDSEIFHTPNFKSRDEVMKTFADKGSNRSVSITSSIDAGFENINDAKTAVSDLNFNFYISNDSLNRTLLAIKTGIDQDSVINVRIQGATGYRWVNGKLEIAYVALRPFANTLVTITATPKISPNDVTYTIKPVLIDIDENELASSQASKIVAPGKTKKTIDRVLEMTGIRKDSSKTPIEPNAGKVQ